MLRQYRKLERITQRVRSQKGKNPRLLSKELDLVVLAGCSCLMTLLYHPVADALSGGSTITSQLRPIVTTQVSRATSLTGHFYVTVPPKRDEIQEDDRSE